MKDNQKTPLYTEMANEKAASINGGCDAQCVYSRQDRVKLGKRSG